MSPNDLEDFFQHLLNHLQQNNVRVKVGLTPFKVNGKSSIPNHWHNSHERMVLLTGKMQVTYKGESTQTMNVGDYAYGPAKKPHTAKCLSKDPCILFIGFGDPLDAFAVEEK